ncbi:Isochorismatase hydrolase [Pleurotus eryngii]|uniref:Isochorismatase hydrolase n=1 Tax=Pleurotus eryngii TaxID=5323 RepID=A0A9P5ZZ77_PLEER|nr:Isochorismatase hydrolase [Pleurotus eryngii]
MPPIHDTPILGMTTRPPVTAPVEYGNSASFWVEYPSGLIDVSLSHHLSPSDHCQSNGGTVTHNGSEKTDGAHAEPPALGENQVDIPVDGGRTVRIDTSATAIVVIDMQNFFLHPDLRDHPTGLKCVDPLLNIVPASRKKGIKVLWVNWGLTEHELKTIPPSLVRGFMKSGRGGFGGQLPGKFGRLLMRGEYNSELYGPLQEEYIKGEKAGTDVWIHKNRMSGLWGYQTALDLWLEENGIKTLFFAGVNADQCVLGTLVDAYFRGYNCLILEDAIATTSPEGGLANVLYNAANSYGFVTDTSRVISALG